MTLIGIIRISEKRWLLVERGVSVGYHYVAGECPSADHAHLLCDERCDASTDKPMVVRVSDHQWLVVQPLDSGHYDVVAKCSTGFKALELVKLFL